MRLIFLTFLTMLAFAGNSVLCRMALVTTSIDAASFTTIRLLSGALMLGAIVLLRAQTSAATAGTNESIRWGGSWPSAVALFLYAASLSFSYRGLTTGTGALLLFGAVQATMILTGLWHGERLSWHQGAGVLMAIAGLIVIVLPGLTAPPLASALLMMASGVFWGIYTLRGRGSSDPISATAGNFWRGASLSAVLSLALLTQSNIDKWGAIYAVLSGALTSGLGYSIWYSVLPKLTMTRAAVVQLSAPMIASLAGALLLHEAITLRLLLASVAILGGIAMVVFDRRIRSA